MNYIPQINYTSIISDKVNWTNITGSYQALGGEQYIIIGNFFSNALTSTVSLSGHYPYSYYYIDDVSVVDCTNEGVNELTQEEKINIHPNPSEGIFQVSSVGFKIKSIRVFDILGCEILKQVQNDVSVTINMSSVGKGIYFVRIEDEKKNVVNRKIVVQ